MARAATLAVSSVLMLSVLQAPATASGVYGSGAGQPARVALWTMDETSGNLAAAVGSSGQARPDADLVLAGGPARGEDGNNGAAVPDDRSVAFNGLDQFGEVKPAISEGSAGEPVPLVDTGTRFMFSTWVKADSTSGDRVAISQASGDGSVFELGWIGGRWSFRHRTANGEVLAEAVRDKVAAPDGTPWTEHWVSLMAGYDPVGQEIWLRTQAPGVAEICPDPDAPWDCRSEEILPPETTTATDTWTPSAGAGSLFFGATPTAGGVDLHWSGRIDDTQVWPLTHSDESLLRVIYSE